MSNLEITPRFNLRAHDARKLFGYAARQDPADLYAHIDCPTPDDLATKTTTHLLEQARRNKSVDTLDRASGLLRAGINDTRFILQSALAAIDSPPSESEALTIVRNPVTVQTIALLALRTEDALAGLILQQGLQYGDNTQYYNIDPVRMALTVDHDQVTGMKHGCPFAGYEGELAPDPLFTRFTKWAGELAVRSLYKHHTAETAPISKVTTMALPPINY